MEKPDVFRTSVFVWLVLLSVGDIWQFNAIKKLSQLKTSRDSSYEHHEEYQYEDDVVEREIYEADISHDVVDKEFDLKHNTDINVEPESHAHTADPIFEENMVFRQNKKSFRKNPNVRESMHQSRLSVQKSKRKLTTDLFIGEDTESKDVQQKNIFRSTKQDFSFRDFNTTCVLLNGDEEIGEFDINELDYMAELFLDFKIRTDKHPEETSWTLSPQHDSNIMVIDSLNDTATAYLSNFTLHTFEYHCVIVSEEEEQKKEISEPFCYDFYLYDWGDDGFCCRYGVGYFELNINKKTTSLIRDRMYKSELGNSFCIDSNGSLVDNQQLYDENESNQYPSRECLNDTCVCDSNPPLLVSNDDNLHGIKLNVMFQMMSLSGSEKLMDINTPQYKAACWILKDDPYFHQHNVSNTSAEKIEERMIQRYILAVFYFATTGEKWDEHCYFLSNRSECEWNSMDGFYDYDYDKILGSICDEDENVMSILFHRNDLEGTIIEELYGLTKLEQLYLYKNENIHGSIPSNLGRLSELRYLRVWESLEGSIPPELFRATKMQAIVLPRNNLSSSLPENIGNLKKLTELDLEDNRVTGSIPESMYSLTSLVRLDLDGNKLSSTISSSISNMKRLRYFWVGQNILTGEIPSSITHLPRLRTIILTDNELSGEIPTGLESLLYLVSISLNDNNLNGVVSDELCEKGASDYDYFYITADCRNDVFAPDVSCSCCSFCTDLTPQRNGECADTTLGIDINHDDNSNYLKWSLVDQSTGQVILYDGPYKEAVYNNTRPSYKACAVNTGCYSLIMKHPPKYNTDYTIFWNDELIHSGAFLGYKIDSVVCPGFSPSEYCDCSGDCDHNPDFCSCTDAMTCCGNIEDDNQNSILTFNYDAQEEKFIFNDTTCNNVQLTCDNNDEVFFIEQNSMERLFYSTAVELSGMSQIQNTSSIQSKALCWILQHENKHNKNTNNDLLQTRFTQRYVLTMLHLMSFNGLFGPNEYPPLSDECNWEGIQCKDNNTNIVTTISLSSSKGQIIDGPLIDEIGSLAFVEVLRFSQTKLIGSIPLLLSNMWSLEELDLSSNSLSGSIPDTFFNELKLLKHLNLSNNTLSSSIPSNIGTNSEISTLILSGNKLIGSVPLENFEWQSLEHLDISENELHSIDLSLLLNHTKFNTINLAANFFVGELEEDIFMLLSQLQYFNVSQNEIGGVIPSSFPDKSNMTHLDVHSNRFSGTVPETLSDLRHVQHLNLQGNRLTGSIPSQLNKLKSLKLMALSNNELKGSIPIDFDSLPDLDSLYLHNNKLSGEAPVVKTKVKKMKAYTSDCGFPSDSLEPVSCSSCSICCNSIKKCQKKPDETIRPLAQALIFIFSVNVFILLLYMMKDRITSSRLLQSYFSDNVENWNALVLISDKSVYQFMLTKNTVGWMIAFGCSIFQLLTLFLFVSAADITSESGDLVYTMTCPSNSLECDNSKSVSAYGFWIFSFILAVWLLRDIASSVKLMLLSFEKRSIDILFTSSVIFLVTVLSAWTSIYYNLAIATKNTELIVNAVILLFVIEIDERLYQLASSWNPMWVAEIEANASDDVNLDDDELLLSSRIQRMSEGLGNLRESVGFYRSSKHGSRTE